MPATVTRISVTPVKGLALHHPDAVELTAGGVPGDRTFFLVDAGGHMVSATRLGALVSVRAEHDVDAGTLSLAFADGGVVSAPVEADEPVPVRFYGRPLDARPLRGPFSAALSELVGHPVQLMLRPPTRPGVDRGARGAATLISSASLRALAAQAGVEEVDPRRFRMTFQIDGLEPHAEDEWVGHEVTIGDARLRVSGHVGRCALTTRNPETGAVDLPTLHVLYAYRGHVQSTEPLPFGVAAAVVQPGRVRLGDVVSGPRPATAAAPPTRPPAR
jgi:MOSC domain-containing protein